LSNIFDHFWAFEMKLSFKSRKLLVSAFIVSLAFAMVLPLFCTSLASAQYAYSVNINTSINATVNGNSVPITEDGLPTGFSTPHTFDLTGTHNFTVPYQDASGHPFREWSINAPTDNAFTTIKVSASGIYFANYDLQVNPNAPGAVQFRFFVTPQDSAVAAASSGKSWSDIINWVATHITFNSTLGDRLQYPNETLAVGSGVCREYSDLCVSMLLSRGYNAYCVLGNISSGENHVWVALELNGNLYHFEPQATCAMQPNSTRWTSGYTAKYFVNNTDFFAALPSLDPPTTATYDVTVAATSNLVSNNIFVPITMDGILTVYTTPYTFSGLTGVHNFTLPYTDSATHSFIQWQYLSASVKYFTTVNASASSTFTATYSTPTYTGALPPSLLRILITPNDPAVITAASGKSWSQIIDYVSSIPAVSHISNYPVQYPNQTLSSGRVFADFASLACSMLRANGYTAYLAGSSGNISTVWVVVLVNGAFIHVNAYSPWAAQITSYQADYYVDQNGLYSAGTSTDVPPADPTPTPTQPPTSTQTPTSTTCPTTTASPTTKPNPTQTPSPLIPEISPNILVAVLIFILTVVLVGSRSKTLFKAATLPVDFAGKRFFEA